VIVATLVRFHAGERELCAECVGCLKLVHDIWKATVLPLTFGLGNTLPTRFSGEPRYWLGFVRIGAHVSFVRTGLPAVAVGGLWVGARVATMGVLAV
jgi:hypothetical protein